MKYILAIDLETTGLIPSYHEITEIGAILLSPTNWSPLATYNNHILIQHPERAVNITSSGKVFDVLAYNHYPMTDPDTIPWSNDAGLRYRLLDFHKWIEKHTDTKSFKEIMLFGQNVKFDISFLDAAYKANGWNYPFNYHSLDLSTVYWVWHHKEFGRPPFEMRLKSIAKHFNIENEKEHTALADISCSVDLYRRMMLDLQPRPKGELSGEERKAG